MDARFGNRGAYVHTVAARRPVARIKAGGATSTPFDRSFPAQAALELNQELRRHNPSATAC